MQLFTGAVAGPPLSDVVVNRRDDGTEVLRVPAGDPTTVPGDMLRLVQRQLEELDLATFHAEWAPEARDRVPEGRAVDTTSRRGTGPRNA